MGAEVTHVDAIRQVVDWTRINMELSGLDGIRWVVEDALKFAQREQRRGNTYKGIVLDPPTWGLGPKGRSGASKTTCSTCVLPSRTCWNPADSSS